MDPANTVLVNICKAQCVCFTFIQTWVLSHRIYNLTLLNNLSIDHFLKIKQYFGKFRNVLDKKDKDKKRCRNSANIP